MATKTQVSVDAMPTHPTPFTVATSIACLLQAAVSEEWVNSHEAEWAAMEGIERVANAVGFEIRSEGNQLLVVEKVSNG